MKKIICLFMVFALLSLVGCTFGEQTGQAQQDGHTALSINRFQNNINNYGESVREFGSPTCYFEKNGNLAISLLYPKTTISDLNTAINAWLSETVERFKNEAAAIQEPLIASYLTISYDSRFAGDSIVGIRMNGRFSSPHIEQPVHIAKTFNYDTKFQELLTIDDIFRKDAGSMLQSTVSLKTGIPAAELEHRLENWLLTDNGIEILLFNSGEPQIITLSNIELLPWVNKPFRGESVLTRLNTIDISSLSGSGKPKPSVNPEKPMIALTFDDGPSVYTEKVLDILDRHGAKGTFFVLGNLIDHGKETLKRIAAEGHEIGSHSWDHTQLTTLGEPEISEQILTTRAKIFEITGKDCFIMRPPYGSYDEKLQFVGRQYDTAFVNWNVDTLDWESKNPEAIINEVETAAENGSIILCHDIYPTTAEAMEAVIPGLVEKGYQLVTVSELMSYSETPLHPGNLYYKR